MNTKFAKVLLGVCIIILPGCTKQTASVTHEDQVSDNENIHTAQTQSHPYGGWYCPDNLNGFPAVDIAKWKNVPVINDRMPAKEETQTSASLIFVDPVQYPDAHPLDLTLPRLASFYSEYTGREELVIVIQAMHVANDSIVGFRYLNGGNGSAKLSDVNLLSDVDIASIPKYRFVSESIEIKASQNEIRDVMVGEEHSDKLRPHFDPENALSSDWRKATNMNYYYKDAGNPTSTFGDIHFGCFYIQNDYDHLKYSEKFLLLENQETGITTLKIVGGPFGDDFAAQQQALKNWGMQVKVLSEKKNE